MNAAAWDDPAGRIRELEAEMHQLHESVEALADEWEGWAKTRSTPRIDAFRDAAESLRALLAGGAR